MKITSEALAHIRECIAQEQDHIAEEDLVPVICWIDNRQGIASDPGPGLGLIERSLVTDGEIDCFVDGSLTIYNGLVGELRDKYNHHILDFSEGNFAFIAPP